MPAEHGSAPAPVPMTIRIRAVSAACLASLALGLALEFAWRWFSIALLDVPTELATLQLSALLVAAVVPALGNGLGYVMTHRRHSSRSRPMFVGPGVVLAGVGLAVSLVQLPAAPGMRAVAITVVLALITPIVTVTVLLTGKGLLVPGVVPDGRVPPAT